MSRGKSVLTVSPSDLVELSQRLLDKAQLDGFDVDAVVGIASGGVHVVNAMRFPEAVLVSSCRLSRPSTATKQSSRSTRVLRSLPTSLSNSLRRLEDWWLERKRLVPTAPNAVLTEQLDGIALRLSSLDSPRVLVVDDAVDSGATLKCVRDELAARLPPGHEIRTAVLTVTRTEDRRCVTPDYFLFEQVLLRFHWSNDYKPAAAL